MERHRRGLGQPPRHRWRPPGDGTDVTWIEQDNGRQSVALAAIGEGGHTWPGADPFNVGLPIGKTTRDIDANEEIWRFFEKHRR